MPSQSVSFTQKGYARIVNSKPENMNLSEWIENLALKGLDEEQEAKN